MTEIARRPVTLETLKDWVLAYSMGSKSRSTKGTVNEVELKTLIDNDLVSVDELHLSYKGIKPTAAIRLRYDNSTYAYLHDISVCQGKRDTLYHLLDGILLQCRNEGISQISTWTTTSAAHTSDVLFNFVFDVKWINIQLKSNLIGIKPPDSDLSLPSGFHIEMERKKVTSDLSVSVLDNELDQTHKRFTNPLHENFRIYHENKENPIVTGLSEKGIQAKGWLVFSEITRDSSLLDHPVVIATALQLMAKSRITEVWTEIDTGSPVRKYLESLGMKPILTLFNMIFDIH